MQTKFDVGSVVKSTYGHDKGELFVVLSVNESNAFIVNGKSRKIEKPKKKNLKHIYLLLKNTDLKELIVNNKATDAHIIKLLKEYKNKELGGN